MHFPVIGDNIEVPGAGPQPWMLELAKMLILKDLPTGMIVGTAMISECRSQNGSTLLTTGAECTTVEENQDDRSSLATRNWQLPCMNGI